MIDLLLVLAVLLTIAPWCILGCTLDRTGKALPVYFQYPPNLDDVERIEVWLHLAVRPGSPSLGVALDEGRLRREFARRERGQRTLLVFWKSWSTPCLKELQRLQRRHEQDTQQHTAILAINDGESLRTVAAVRRRLKLTYELIPDPHRRICQRYRVHCWPTVVGIDEQGMVDRVHIGLRPNRAAPSEPPADLRVAMTDSSSRPG